jgi:hypothetical protein
MGFQAALPTPASPLLPPDATTYAHFLFNAFDADGNGAIHFEVRPWQPPHTLLQPAVVSSPCGISPQGCQEGHARCWEPATWERNGLMAGLG